MGPIEKSIRDKLSETFQPDRLEVINESHLHAGHQGGAMDGTGESHFRVRIVSSSFAGKNRVARHRAINDALRDDLADGIHALAIEVAAPDETTRW